ncbi:MAG: S41 family peptidase [Candidatus Acidiferrales bacterium]
MCLFCCAFVLAAFVRSANAQSSPSQSSTNTPRLNSTARAAVAEKFARALADNYAYADKGAAMASAIRAKLNSGAYNGITSPMDFADALERDVRAVSHDLHLEVDFRPADETPDEGTSSPSLGNALPEVKLLDGNIGYIVLNGMLPNRASSSAIAAAFAFVHDTDALILDLRGNPGGAGPVAADIMSYLSAGPPYLLHTIHWRNGAVHESRTTNLGDRSYGNKKPVFVLTSHRTFSAAEDLAYDLQSFKRGTIVGETTGGGANPSMSGGSASLGHGFFADIPTGYVVNAATGTNWEGVGVKPDVNVTADDALAKAWSLALARVGPNAADPETRALLAALSSAKLDGQPSLSTAQLIGRYVSKSGDATMVITERDGNLYGEVRYNDGEAANIIFRPAGGDRYVRVGFPDGFSFAFAERDGRIELVQLQPPPRESPIWEKQ